MSLKLYLNKYLKVDNIEYYTLPCLKILQQEYDNLLKKTEGLDPDFPQLDFGEGVKGMKFGSKNKLDENSKKMLNKIWQSQRTGMRG